MHIFSQSLAAAVVAVVETPLRIEVYLFLQAVITSLSQIKVINNQLQNKTQLCSMKKKNVITMEDITSLIYRSQPRLPGTTNLRPFNLFKEKHHHIFIYPTSFIGTGTKDSLVLNCLPKAMLSCSKCSD